MVPVEKFGVKMLSIGFLVDPDQAIVWRGPMASKALRQLFSDADWGELDYMLIDLPPGTGDIHLTLVSAVPVTGAVDSFHASKSGTWLMPEKVLACSVSTTSKSRF
jgi:ATP-binding protein involved in chromosome partitioning